MNVSELARQLRTHSKKMLEILPNYGFDIGQKAVKVDDKVAAQIMNKWKFIKRDLEEKMRREMEEKKQKEKEMNKISGKSVIVPEVITVRNFAERLGIPVNQLIVELMKNGILANQNQNIDFETTSIIGEELGYIVNKETTQIDPAMDQEKTEALAKAFADSKNLQKRSPVVVVMGHVDHGKTKLLDTIRQTNIIDTESGGITQHIGAYQTVWKDPKNKKEKAITFIDTPGHEAFTVMRSRGAKVADIAILVVAADDGVRPQTEEVIQIIRAAKLPFIVAINKVDKSTADVKKVKTELAQKNVLAEDWGGDVPMVEISAKQKINIDKLLDLLLLIADMNEENIQADPDIQAIGTIIESNVDKNIGPVATVLVQAGTLNKNDALVVNGEIYGKVRAMKNYKAELIENAGPSVPVQIIGFKVAPEVGDILDVARAKDAKKINVKEKRSIQTAAEKHTISQIQSQDEEVNKKTVNVLIKADVLGSLEAIIGSLEKIQHDEVGVKIIGKGLGNITEDDVLKAEAGHGFIVGFKVRANTQVEEVIREKNIIFLRYDIIYDLLDWVKKELEKLLEVEKFITELGNIKVLAIFRTDKSAMTVGGRVEEGKIKENSSVRVKRKNEIIGFGKIVECQTGKSKVKEVPSGTECGVRFEGKVKIEQGDLLEVYIEESKARKIVFG